MKFNSAAQNLLLAHMDATVSGVVSGQFKQLIVTLRSGTVPTEAQLRTAFNNNDSLAASVPQASNTAILSALGGGATIAQTTFTAASQYGPLLDRKKRGYNLTTAAEVTTAAAGTITWALVGMANDSTYAHTFYLLSVGLVGSGADLEMDKTTVALNDKIKFSTILLDHSFIIGA